MKLLLKAYLYASCLLGCAYGISSSSPYFDGIFGTIGNIIACCIYCLTHGTAVIFIFRLLQSLFI